MVRRHQILNCHNEVRITSNARRRKERRRVRPSSKCANTGNSARIRAARDDGEGGNSDSPGRQRRSSLRSADSESRLKTTKLVLAKEG